MPLTWAISLKYQRTLNYFPILKFNLFQSSRIPISDHFTGATCGVGTSYTSGHLSSLPSFYLSLWGSCCSCCQVDCAFQFLMCCLQRFLCKSDAWFVPTFICFAVSSCFIDLGCVHLRILVFVWVLQITVLRLSLSLGSLYCLVFLDCRLLNTNLISSAFSSLQLLQPGLTKHVMWHLKIQDFKFKYHDCTFVSS